MAITNITKEQFKNLIVKCFKEYEESWTNMDVIQPFGFETCQTTAFRTWFSSKYPKIYKQVISICNQDIIWNYKDIWCMLDALTSLNTSQLRSIDIFTDYCFDNPDFMQAVYNEGQEYLDEVELDNLYDN